MKDGVWSISVADFADDEAELKNTFKTELRVMLTQIGYEEYAHPPQDDQSCP
jgi:hypothetical protein